MKMVELTRLAITIEMDLLSAPERELIMTLVELMASHIPITIVECS